MGGALQASRRFPTKRSAIVERVWRPVRMSISVSKSRNRPLGCSGPEVIIIGIPIPMGIPVNGHSVARPTFIGEFPPLLVRTDHRCCGGGGQFTNVQIDARVHNARFLDEIERVWITLELIGQVGERIEIDFESRTRLIRADFSMADDMIAVAADGPASANLIDQPSAGVVQRIGPDRLGPSFMFNTDRIPICIDIELKQSPSRRDDPAGVPSPIALADILMDLSAFPDPIVG